MIVIDKNPGTKVDYTVEDTHITFGDDLGLNPREYLNPDH